MFAINTPQATLLIVVAIGIAAGLVFKRHGQGWLARQISRAQSGLTWTLVGIAGSFIGFHLWAALGFSPSPVASYLAAAAGAAVVLWAWRGK